jgi:hypothetical protein
MTDMQALYAEIKPEIQIVSARLFDLSKTFLDAQDNFLPHAAVLTAESKIELVGAQGQNDLTNSAEILPLLQGGLRELAKRKALTAIGIAENVIITPPGKSATSAIKVLFEHRRGITVALYLPFEKNLLGGYVFQDMLSLLAKPEVNAWLMVDQRP